MKYEALLFSESVVSFSIRTHITNQGQQSQVNPVILGVPYGSVFGPVLFFVYADNESEHQRTSLTLCRQWVCSVSNHAAKIPVSPAWLANSLVTAAGNGEWWCILQDYHAGLVGTATIYSRTQLAFLTSNINIYACPFSYQLSSSK